MSQPTTIQGKPDYTDLLFPDPPDDRPTLIVNMVMSADGSTPIAVGTQADK